MNIRVILQCGAALVTGALLVLGFQNCSKDNNNPSPVPLPLPLPSEDAPDDQTDDEVAELLPDNDEGIEAQVCRDKNCEPQDYETAGPVIFLRQNQGLNLKAYIEDDDGFTYGWYKFNADEDADEDEPDDDLDCSQSSSSCVSCSSTRSDCNAKVSTDAHTLNLKFSRNDNPADAPACSLNEVLYFYATATKDNTTKQAVFRVACVGNRNEANTDEGEDHAEGSHPSAEAEDDKLLRPYFPYAPTISRTYVRKKNIGALSLPAAKGLHHPLRYSLKPMHYGRIDYGIHSPYNRSFHLHELGLRFLPQNRVVVGTVKASAPLGVHHYVYEVRDRNDRTDTLSIQIVILHGYTPSWPERPVQIR